MSMKPITIQLLQAQHLLLQASTGASLNNGVITVVPSTGSICARCHRLLLKIRTTHQAQPASTNFGDDFPFYLQVA
jgi:hypothetical protein